MAVLLRRRGCNTRVAEMLRKYKMENESLNENGLILFNVVKADRHNFYLYY